MGFVVRWRMEQVPDAGLEGRALSPRQCSLRNSAGHGQQLCSARPAWMVAHIMSTRRSWPLQSYSIVALVQERAPEIAQKSSPARLARATA